MLSVIVYGRNDNHGYNYHKRLSLSLNCIAEVLSSPTDEILFTDYNSPDDEPTIIESLQDTLTPKAKSLLRIFRIRSQTHQFYKTHLNVLEPLARNVALRRSCPQNTWILSTNIDMIFVPMQANQSLSSIVEKLPEGFYQLPRFELPESLWESRLNRFLAQENISFLRDQSSLLHLNTIVKKPGFLMFDNPGDFQLMMRKDIYAIGGFNEEMIYGWHVDSNLCKRMYLFHDKKIHSLENSLLAYHCNHNRKPSILHSKNHAENDWTKFIHEVNSPYLSHQSESWGLPKETIEEIRLDPHKHFFDNHSEAIKVSLHPFQKEPYALEVSLTSYNTLTYQIPRIFPHLVDHLHHLPKNSAIAYIGYNQKLFDLLKSYLNKMNFEIEVIDYINLSLDLKNVHSTASLFIFDFGFDTDSVQGERISASKNAFHRAKKDLKLVMKVFLKIVKLERRYKRNLKLLGINLLHTDYRILFYKHLTLTRNSFITGIIYGYLSDQQEEKHSKNGHHLVKKIIFNLRYFLIKYFHNSIDTLRNFLHRYKILEKIFKSLN